MKSLFTLINKESTEIIRSKKLLILIIIFGFISISSPILAKVIPDILKNINTNGIVFNVPDPSWKDAIDQLVKNTSQFGLIVIIFMFAGAISEEKNKKTLEMILTKPISRPSFVLGKFFAGSFYISTIFLLSQIIFYFYTISLFGSFDLINFIWLSLFMLVFLLSIFAVSLFFSAIAKSQLIAAGLAFVVSILITSLVGYIEALKDYSPSYIITNYKELMINGDYSSFLPSFYTNLIIIILLIILAISSFSKQEVER